MKITNIERIDVEIPYLERVREHLWKGWGFGNRATDEEFAAERDRFNRKWEEFPTPSVRTSLFLVHTDEGLTGVGEGGALEEEEMARCEGHSPFEYIMDDAVGALQIAFYDLMGQALGLPIARLLGPSRASAPLAFWSHCFSPEVLREEAALAVEGGYRVHKFKRRAHTDVVEQVAAIAEVTPEKYEITVDANQTFGTVERALIAGKRMKEYSQLHCLESPIDQGNVDGYRRLKEELGLPLAHHMGNPDPVEALHSGVYDYFILGARVAGAIRNGAVIAAREKTFWMQATGTDIATLFMLHVAAGVPNATLAHVATNHLNEAQLLREPLVVIDGEVAIPENPGLGATLDRDVVERYRI